MDILSALEATPGAGVSGRRCVIQRFIDDVPEDAPGRDRLVGTLTSNDPKDPDYRTREQLLLLLARLGLNTTVSSIGDHRGVRCVCNA